MITEKRYSYLITSPPLYHRSLHAHQTLTYLVSSADHYKLKSEGDRMQPQTREYNITTQHW